MNSVFAQSHVVRRTLSFVLVATLSTQSAFAQVFVGGGSNGPSNNGIKSCMATFKRAANQVDAHEKLDQWQSPKKYIGPAWGGLATAGSFLLLSAGAAGNENMKPTWARTAALQSAGVGLVTGYFGHRHAKKKHNQYKELVKSEAEAGQMVTLLLETNEKLPPGILREIQRKTAPGTEIAKIREVIQAGDQELAFCRPSKKLATVEDVVAFVKLRTDNVANSDSPSVSAHLDNRKQDQLVQASDSVRSLFSSSGK